MEKRTSGRGGPRAEPHSEIVWILVLPSTPMVVLDGGEAGCPRIHGDARFGLEALPVDCFPVVASLESP